MKASALAGVPRAGVAGGRQRVPASDSAGIAGVVASDAGSPPSAADAAIWSRKPSVGPAVERSPVHRSTSPARSPATRTLPPGSTANDQTRSGPIPPKCSVTSRPPSLAMRPRNASNGIGSGASETPALRMAWVPFPNAPPTTRPPSGSTASASITVRLSISAAGAAPPSAGSMACTKAIPGTSRPWNSSVDEKDPPTRMRCCASRASARPWLVSPSASCVIQRAVPSRGSDGRRTRSRECPLELAAEFRRSLRCCCRHCQRLSRRHRW